MERYTIIQTIKKAILKGESTFQGIALPSRQSAGTYFQQNTYAQIQAQKVYEQHFVKFNH